MPISKEGGKEGRKEERKKGGDEKQLEGSGNTEGQKGGGRDPHCSRRIAAAAVRSESVLSSEVEQGISVRR